MFRKNTLAQSLKFMFNPEDGGSTLLRNFLHNKTVT